MVIYICIYGIHGYETHGFTKWVVTGTFSLRYHRYEHNLFNTRYTFDNWKQQQQQQQQKDLFCRLHTHTHTQFVVS